MLLAMTVFGVAFGGTSLAMLWSNKTGGFGSRLAVRRAEIEEAIRLDGRYYSPEGRFYVVPYPHTGDEENIYVQAGVATDGLMTLYQKCAHLGCRVPFCPTSQWFECPCHGSRYNKAGEVQPGSPAPAGLWRFTIEADGQDFIVDTANPTAQPAKGVDTIGQPPEGPHCIATAEGSGH
jgi:cytochrome b6-f complex iron-sulfur subunit